MALAASALLAVVMMHHHPHGGDGAAMIRAVHGGLLAMIVVQPAVMALVARALGWNMTIALGLTLVSLGSLGAIVAGTINGFVVPAIGEYTAGDIGPGIGELAWEMNQQFARNGAVAMGAGIVCFGIALWQAGWRVTGALGVIAGGVTAALLITGVTDMRFYGAMLTYIVQLSWLALLGVMLARGAGGGGATDPA
jgi:hypothetical protein